jgi:hypothetical protein
VHSLSLLLIGEIVKGRSVENEVQAQELISKGFLIKVITDTEEIGSSLPMFNGFKNAAARCMMGAFFTTSIPIAGLNSRQDLPGMFTSLANELGKFTEDEDREDGAETAGAVIEGDFNFFNDRTGNDEDQDALADHFDRTARIASRFWVCVAREPRSSPNTHHYLN